MSSSSASCAVRATLGFWFSYLNAWELYSGQCEVERKSVANSLELKGVGAGCPGNRTATCLIGTGARLAALEAQASGRSRPFT
jgi:hypothetical protein